MKPNLYGLMKPTKDHPEKLMQIHPSVELRHGLEENADLKRKNERLIKAAIAFLDNKTNILLRLDLEQAIRECEQ